jgi:alkylation response protein AidB-like acyl-CoA dehydrogenase
MSYRNTLEFLMYGWLQAHKLNTRPRFVDHSRETFDAVLDTCERIAREKFAPFNRMVDRVEPRTEVDADGALIVVLPKATHEARAAYAESGMLSAAQDEAMGGMQLPYLVEAAANSFFGIASISIGWNLLTVGNANAILACGTETQKQVFAANEFNGRWAGTMCLSEPQAGSSLSDVTTRAELEDAGDALGPRYRLRGSKMWISGGEHDVTENIIHLVLAKIPDENGKLIPGTRGISLFIVPKKMVNAQGELTGQRNDVTLAGLNHKLGWAGTPNTLLNFGEGKFKPDGNASVDGKPHLGLDGRQRQGLEEKPRQGAVGYLVGKPGEGLKGMFHMMNEARIAIGMAATSLGLAGYYASLDYAKQRPQGRPITGSGKDPNQPQVRLIEHTDIKRMLLAQKSICEGALALQLYCAKLVDDKATGDAVTSQDAALLLEILTPISKSWPSENCLEANSLAIQIHGGYGYTRDFPVEQYWRDQRLNMIHEGTHAIQAMDLLGRKVVMDGGKGLALLASKINATVERAVQIPELAVQANQLAGALQKIGSATKAAWITAQPQEALANAVPYMQAFGHVVLAWIWLDVSLAKLDATKSVALHAGITSATQYFYRYELPKIDAWLAVVSYRDMTCAEVAEEAF